MNKPNAEDNNQQQSVNSTNVTNNFQFVINGNDFLATNSVNLAQPTMQVILHVGDLSFPMQINTEGAPIAISFIGANPINEGDQS